MEIAKEAITPTWTHGMILEAIDRSDTYFITLSKNKDGEYTNAQGAAYIVGFSALRQVGEDGEILQIAVDNDFRKNGYGSEMMENMIAYAYNNSFKSLFLEVRKSNTSAIHLYKKYGFAIQRTRKNYYTEPIEDAYVMVCNLNTGENK
jgi:ribosomal-protein-alanine N-acetyltransferase